MKPMTLMAAALVGALSSYAANPVAVWDGNFNATQPGYTLNLNGNQLSQDNSTITINQSVGVTVDFSTGVGAMTVMFKYSDLAFGAQKTLATSFCSGGDENRTGVYVASDETVNGIWNTADWAHPSAQLLANASGALAFCYSKAAGTSLYYVSAQGVRTETYNQSGLKSSNDTAINGCAIGGERAKSGATLLSAATGMKITGIAIFDGILTEAEMTGYVWPSETQTISVTANTSVSAINAQFDSTTYKVAKVSVADGVTITVDAAFDPTIRSVSSVGSVTLSAASQPASSYFAHVDFSGVQGALFRSWLTPGVVGFNFRSANGTDVSGALATADNWIHDNNSVSGTSTSMFADGLSTLTWSSGGTWACSGSTIISGYLDDGANGGNGATVTLSGVPYETYDVIVYCSSDSNPGQFLAKTVNGTTYTWDSTAGAVVAGNAAWGKAALSTPVYGVNALRIKNLSGPLTIYGTARNGSNRGGIAAFQIMPPNTPDNIRTYTLSLNGTATTWSGGTWTLNGQTVDAPTSGYVEIVASASTSLTVDQAVSLTDLKVRGGANIVVNVATSGNGSISAVKATVESGVFQQGSPAVLGATPSIVVASGATFDENGMAVNAANAVTIAGAGAGNWPWALTSSGGAGGAILGGLYLSDDATIGGANEVRIGQTQAGYYCYLQGFTLTKTGAGALVGTNMNTPGTGTIDVQGGAMSVNQWNNLNNNSGDTTVILNSGTSLTNVTDRVVPMGTLKLLGGTLSTANKAFKVNTLLTGSGSTANLVFADGASASLTGDLTVTSTLTLDGAMAFNKDANAAGNVAVTVSGSLTASGAITVGAGVTFNLGTNRPEGVLTIDDNGTLTVAKANASDAPMLRVSAQPASIVLYDENGNAVDSPYVAYDSENGTITIVGGGNIWTGASGTWSSGQFDGRAVSTEGSDVSFGQGTPPQSAVTVTVDGAKSVNTASFIASTTAYTLTGDKITTAGGLTVGGAAPVVVCNAIDGAVTINSGSELTLAGTASVLQSGVLSGSGTLVLDPGAGNTYTMSTANTNFTGEAVIKSGTVKMGNETSFGQVYRDASIRVKGGATLDENLADCKSQYYKNDGHAHKVVLEEGAVFKSSTDNLYQGKPDNKYAPVSVLTLEGNASVVADVADVAISLAYNWDYTHVNLGEYTLTKTGTHELYLSCADITGSGTLDIQAGTMTICNNYDNYLRPKFPDGTLKIASGVTFNLTDYNNNYPVFTVKNLELNGGVYRSNAGSTLTVTGYITGNGTTPMLTMGSADARIVPNGKGPLNVTESLSLYDDKLIIDLSGFDFSGNSLRSIPLIWVGNAQMLPAKSSVWFRYTADGELTQELPVGGWRLITVGNGRGYRLSKNRFSMILR